jgi:hypothetical protein
LRPCTLSDFGIDSGETTTSKFYPVSASYREDLEKMMPLLQCIDTPFQLNGNFNSGVS